MQSKDSKSMKILCLDTASAICAAAISLDKVLVSECIEVIGKGHAERLNGQIAKVCEQAGVTLGEIDRIAVNSGPGSFTGIRVGVATARALALALGKPAIGVSQFAALAYEAQILQPAKPITVVIQAFNNSVYCQNFSVAGAVAGEALVIESNDLAKSLSPQRVVIGSGVASLEPFLDQGHFHFIKKDHPDIATFGLIAGRTSDLNKPTPLYIREPLAEPPTVPAVPLA